MNDVMSVSLIGRFGSSAFRRSTNAVLMSLTGARFSSESAPGPFHHGGPRTRRNNLLGGLAATLAAGPSGHTISPHPSSREGLMVTISAALASKHHWLIIACDACGTIIDLDLTVKRRDPDAPIRVALNDVRCPRCNGHGRTRIIGNDSVTAAWLIHRL